jgi:hypothetical protein
MKLTKRIRITIGKYLICPFVGHKQVGSDCSSYENGIYYHWRLCSNCLVKYDKYISKDIANES